MKQLVFDATDATSLAHSDSVGAFVRSSDGTLIDKATINSVERLAVDSTLKDGSGTALTSTLEAGKQGLDVYIAGGASIEVDLDHTEDSVRLGNGTDFLTSTTVGADIGLDVNLINASIEVTATDLDIRDLSAAQDNVAAYLSDAAGTGITSTLDGGKQALDVFIANEISVNDAALANVDVANASVTLGVADTDQAVVGTALSDRKYLLLRNEANKEIYIGGSGVTASNGFPVSPKQIIELRAGAAVALNFVGSAGATPEIRTLELS